MKVLNFEGVDPRKGRFSNGVEDYARSQVSARVLHPEVDSWPKEVGKTYKPKTRRNLGRNAVGEAIGTQEDNGENDE